MPVVPYSPADSRAGRRRLELALLLTMLLSSAMFAVAERRATYLAISAVAIAVHAAAAFRRREVCVRRLLLNLAVVALGVLLVWRFLSSRQNLLVALGHYVSLIQLCKLFERKRHRDYVQMLVMSLLLALAAGMMSQDLLFGVLSLLYVVSVAYTAAALTMWRSRRDAVLSAPAGAAGGPGRWPGGALAARLAVLLVGVLAAGVVVFIVCPRSVAGSSPMNPFRRDGRSGFSDNVRLGRPREITLSDRVVMHVRFTAAEGTPLGDVGPAYFRGRVYTRYADSRWDIPPSARTHSPVYVPSHVLDRTVRQEVSMVPDLLPTTFVCYPTIKVLAPGRKVRKFRYLQYGLDDHGDSDAMVTYTGLLVPPEPTTPQRRYLQALRRHYRARSRGEDFSVAVPPRVAALARQWCAPLLLPGTGRVRPGAATAAARRMADRLGERCTYSLDLTDADPGRDGVEDFLFHLRRGHCEYYASALTVMCHAVGITARLATGFCSQEVDADGRYVVRQKDAHAWTEVYGGDGRWVTVEATPAGRLNPPARRGWNRWWVGLGQTWRDWEFLWYSRVVGYDEESRLRLARQIREMMLHAWSAVRAAAAAVWQGLVALFARGEIEAAVVWFFLAVAFLSGLSTAGGLLLRWRRARRPRRRGLHRPRPPAFFARVLKLLRRHGVRPRADQTPREWAAAAAAGLDLPPELLGELIERYYRIRWGGVEPTPADLAAADEAVRRLTERLAE